MATTGFAIATRINRLALNVKDEDRFSRETSWIVATLLRIVLARLKSEEESRSQEF
jgi:hypothetical protein